MFKDGVLVDLHIGWWRAHKSLSANDLNIREEDVPDIFNLGVKLLIPKEERAKFNKIEQRSRKRLEAYSFPFFVGTTCRFVPLKMLENVIQDLNESKKEFDQLVEEMLDNYDDIRDAMLVRYHDIRESLEPFYPSLSLLRTKYYFKWNVFEIGEATEACTAELTAEYENFKRRLNDEFNSFVSGAVKDLRSEVSTTCDKLLKKIEGGEIIKEQTLTSVKNVIDRFDKLNFVGDGKVSESLDVLRSSLSSVSGKDISNDVNIRGRVSDLAKQVSRSAKDLSDIDEVTGEYLRRVRIRDNAERAA